MVMEPWTYYHEKCGVESAVAQTGIAVATTGAVSAGFAGAGALLALATGTAVLASSILLAPAGALVAATYMLTSLLLKKDKISLCVHTSILTGVAAVAVGGTLAAGIVLGLLSPAGIITISVIAGLGLLYMVVIMAIHCAGPKGKNSDDEIIDFGAKRSCWS